MHGVITNMATWKLVCFAGGGLAISLFTAGCSGRQEINGEFNVSYAWIDGKLQNTVIEMTKPKGPTSEATRRAVIETGQTYIAGTMQASDLRRANGRIRVSIYGTPPYFVQIGASAITEPDFSELRAAVEKEDIGRILQLTTTFENANQRELPSRQTAIAIAAAGGHVKSVQTLLALGADPNIADGIGVTPLMNADPSWGRRDGEDSGPCWCEPHCHQQGWQFSNFACEANSVERKCSRCLQQNGKTIDFRGLFG